MKRRCFSLRTFLFVRLVCLLSVLTALALSGKIREFAVPTASSFPEGITAGPDGNLWFTEIDGNNIGRITTAGVVTEFPVPTASSEPEGIAAGPDGNIWFTEFAVNKIGQLR